MAKVPKISVVAITYNHEKYIREALEGFVMQKTDFDFEIVIADDCSTDKTKDIIKEYAASYSDIFRPVFREKNVGVAKNLYGALRSATGEYIALCEGDDFWIDHKKLQIQADFLDKHPDHALCFHPVKVFFENNLGKEQIYPDPQDKNEFTLEDLLRKNYIQTNSVMYRRRKYEDLPDNILPVDWYLHLFHAKFGKIGFINNVMAAYRRHPGGIWWNSHKDINEIWKKHGLAHLALYVGILDLFDESPSHKKIIFDHISNMIFNLSEVDKKYNKRLLKEALIDFPKIIEPLMIHLMRERAQNEKTIEGLRALKVELNLKEGHVKNLEEELKSIKEGRLWRLSQSMRRLIK